MLISKLHTIFMRFIFEKDALIEELERMGAEEFKRRARKSDDPRAAFSYKDPYVKSIVWNMKFRRNRRCFELAAEAMADLAGSSLLVPMPLSRKRRRERGYNQTELLAEEMAKHADIKIISACLSRKHAPAQTSLSRAERRKNLIGIFEVVNAEMIMDRDIILLDDVITTGATMEAASKALLSAGARSVTPLAFAH